MGKKLILLLFVILSISISAQDKPVIVLVDPGYGDIRTITNLVTEGVITIDPLFNAVYYSESENEAEDAERYKEDHDIDFLEIEVVEGELSPENIYTKNDLTDDFRKIFERSDGIIFFGGADIQPWLYGEKTGLLTNIRTPNRHLFELSFLFHLLGGSQDENYTPLLKDKPQYPVYGFCLGMQTMAVAAGGTLYQDIPTDVYDIRYTEDLLELGPDLMHKNYYRSVSEDKDLSYRAFHKIKYSDGFFTKELGREAKELPTVCSHHHQAVDDPGKNFVVVASTTDGKIVEAIEHTEFPNVLGVQFHPEVYTLYTEGEGYKFSPEDKTLKTEYTLMKETGSLDFHLRFWEYFSSLYNEKPEG